MYFDPLDIRPWVHCVLMWPYICNGNSILMPYASVITIITKVNIEIVAFLNYESGAWQGEPYNG